MTKFTRTIKTTTYNCKVYNRATDELEYATFTAEGMPLTGRKLSKLIESSSGFEDKGLQYLHVEDTYTTERKYWCTLEEFLSIAHTEEESDTEEELADSE